MKLSAEKKQQLEERLTQENILDSGDTIEEYIKGDYYTFMCQNRGSYSFTKDKIIFNNTFFTTVVGIPYKNIQEIKKCFVGPFIPTGIKITVIDDNGKQKKHKLSVLGRKQWINYIAQRSGISI